MPESSKKGSFLLHKVYTVDNLVNECASINKLTVFPKSLFLPKKKNVFISDFDDNDHFKKHCPSMQTIILETVSCETV